VLTKDRAEARFFYVDVIWGRSYANLFTNVSLASRLSPGNLPAMPNNSESKTILVTTDQDRAHIMRSSLFRQLERVMEVVFLPLQITTQAKYDLMSTGHRQAIEHVASQGYCVFFSPDTIVAEGSIPWLYELAQSGRQIVAGCGPCVNHEAFLNEISLDPDVDTGRVLTLPSRKLVELILRNLHNVLAHQKVQSQFYPQQPNACVWDAPSGDGMLARVLNMHPYLFDTRLVTSTLDLFNATLDWWMIPRSIRNPNSYYVITDSDEFCVCGLLPKNSEGPLVTRKFDPTVLALYLTETGCPYVNRNNLLYALKFHTQDLDDSWVRLEQESQDAALAVIDPTRLLKPFILEGKSKGTVLMNSQQRTS
jgi:hypothetical protein